MFKYILSRIIIKYKLLLSEILLNQPAEIHDCSEETGCLKLQEMIINNGRSTYPGV